MAAPILGDSSFGSEAGTGGATAERAPKIRAQPESVSTATHQIRKTAELKDSTDLTDSAPTRKFRQINPLGLGYAPTQLGDVRKHDTVDQNLAKDRKIRGAHSLGAADFTVSSSGKRCI
jgi:hypothetical protein